MSNSTDGSSLGLADKATTKTKTSPAAIVGATLGSVALSIMLVVGAVLIYRARVKRRRAMDEKRSHPFPHSATPRADEAIALMAATPPITPDWMSNHSVIETTESTQSSHHRLTYSLAHPQPSRLLSVTTSRGHFLLDARSDSATADVDSPPPYIYSPTTDETHVIFRPLPVVPLQTAPSSRKRGFNST